MFKTNTSKAAESFDIKPEGDYEIIIKSAEVKDFTRSDGSKTAKISFQYVIRNDVEQHFKNGYIFDEIWKKREPNEDDLAVDGFNFGQLMAIAKAAKLPDGKDYDSVQAFLNDLVGLVMKVHLKHDVYNGKTSEKVDRKDPTAFPEVKHVWKTAAASGGYAKPADTFAAASTATSEADDDYPF